MKNVHNWTKYRFFKNFFMLHVTEEKGPYFASGWIRLNLMARAFQWSGFYKKSTAKKIICCNMHYVSVKIPENSQTALYPRWVSCRHILSDAKCMKGKIKFSESLCLVLGTVTICSDIRMTHLTEISC